MPLGTRNQIGDWKKSRSLRPFFLSTHYERAPLQGNPKRWSVRVTGNYRITFGWSGEDDSFSARGTIFDSLT